MRQRARGIGLACSLTLLTCTPARAEIPLQPFATANQFPLAQIYGLPSLRAPDVLPAGQHAFDLTLELTNHLEISSDATDQAVVDGEQHRLALAWRAGFADGWEWSAELPLLRQSGGFMDSAISSYHDAFGFSDGRRDEVEDDEILYRYVRGGRTLLRLDQSASGIGDLRLGLTRRLTLADAQRGASVSGLLKLPTGDSDDLTGSGGTDVSLWGSYGGHAPGSRWSWVGSLGAFYTSEGDVLAELRQRSGLLGGFTLGYQLLERLQLKAQIYAHSPLYEDSPLESIAGTPIVGIFGLNWKASERYSWDLAFTEDLNDDASADFGVHVALRRSAF